MINKQRVISNDSAYRQINTEKIYMYRKFLGHGFWKAIAGIEFVFCRS